MYRIMIVGNQRITAEWRKWLEGGGDYLIDERDDSAKALAELAERGHAILLADENRDFVARAKEKHPALVAILIVGDGSPRESVADIKVYAPRLDMELLREVVLLAESIISRR